MLDRSSGNKSVFTKEWANDQLRAALTLLKEGFLSEKHWLWNQRLAAAIIFKTELEGRGFPWQAARINNQIHRYQGKINRLHAGGAGVTSERQTEEGSF